MDSNKLVSHVFDTHIRLTNTIRYSTIPKFAEENVATHSFFVAYIAMLLCDYVNVEVNRERTLSMALIHDVEESLTGDIIYNIKRKSVEFSEAVLKLNRGIISEIYGGEPKYLGLWEEYKACKTTEAKIVEAADRLSSVIYSIEETKLGNTYIREVFDNNLKSLEGLGLDGLDKVIQEFNKMWEESHGSAH